MSSSDISAVHTATRQLDLTLSATRQVKWDYEIGATVTVKFLLIQSDICMQFMKD